MASNPPALQSPSVEIPYRDFPDWLSPILVKELRQGLRSKAFITSFCLIHTALILLFLFTLLSELGSSDPVGYRRNLDDLNGFFWLIVAAPVLFILPGSALNLIGDEVSAKTLELIQLTKLSPLRIVQGKWFAVAVQILLLIVSILPYFAFRYFLGKIDLITESFVLAVLCLGGLFLSCFFLFLSTLSKIWRILILIQAIPTLFFGVIGITFNGASSFDFFKSDNYLPIILSLSIISVFYIVYGLLMTATFVSGAKYTWSGVKRAMGLIIFVAWLSVMKHALSTSVFDSGVFLTVNCLLPLLGLIIFEGLCYHPSYSLRDHYEMARSGFIRRMQTLFSLTGWPAHFFYCAAIFGIAVALIYGDFFKPPFVNTEGGDAYVSIKNSTAVGAVVLFATLIFHLVISRIFPRFRNLFLLAFILQIIISSIGMLLGTVLVANQIQNGIYVPMVVSVIPQFAFQFGFLDGLSYQNSLPRLKPEYGIIPGIYLLLLAFWSLKRLKQWYGLRNVNR